MYKRRPTTIEADPSRYVFEELDRIEEAFHQLLTGFGFQVYTAEPTRKRKFMVVLADGVNWDPLTLGVPHLVLFDGTVWQPVSG